MPIREALSCNGPEEGLRDSRVGGPMGDGWHVPDELGGGWLDGGLDGGSEGELDGGLDESSSRSSMVQSS